jgi:hypothetical protein
MYRHHISSILALALTLLFTTGFSVHAQDLDKTTVSTMVSSGKFIFKAQSANPMTGNNVQLTADYDLKVSPDSLVAFLPYFGRAYTVNPTAEGGIKFTSTDFVYKSKQKKKKGWEVSINPRDTRDVRQMSLSISPNGYATLQVISNNRQSISFYGFLAKS